MARTRHIAGVLGLFASTVGAGAGCPPSSRGARAGGDRRGAASSARWARTRTPPRPTQLAPARHDDPRHRRRVLPPAGRTALEREARALDVDAVAGGDPRVTSDHGGTEPPLRSSSDRALQWSIGRPRRRAGRGRRPAGRRPSRPAAADSLDRGDRAAAPRLADVRRRHRRAAPRPAPARHRAGAAALPAPQRDRPSIAACASCCWRFFLWLVVPGMAADRRQRRASGCRRAACRARRFPRSCRSRWC